MAFRERSGEGQSPFRFDAMALPIPGHLSTGVSTHLSTLTWYWHDNEVSWFCGLNRGREEPGRTEALWQRLERTDGPAQ